MTDKLREAALWKLLTEAREALWQPANPDLCGRIDEALAQQDAPSALCQRCVPVCRGGAGCFAGMPDTDPSKMTVVKVVSPAQQDAQAVAQDEIVAAWKSGMTVQYFVTIGHDDEWTDYTNPTPPDTSGTRLAWRVKPGQRSNAAPTPPARATLTARELLNMMPESIPAEHDNALLEYARDIIEAYKQKNGIK